MSIGMKYLDNGITIDGYLVVVNELLLEFLFLSVLFYPYLSNHVLGSEFHNCN